MTNYSANEFKSGLKVMIDGDPCNIIENEYVKPGKGQAFNRVRYRNLKTGRTFEKTFRSSDTLPGADVVEKEMNYLYFDGTVWHFMVPGTYEQYEAHETAMIEARQWIKEDNGCQVTLWNNAVLTVVPPTFVTLKVTQTDPGLKGDTAAGATKPATLETDAVVKVPLFVNEGDLLKIDTRTGEYVSRVKE